MVAKLRGAGRSAGAVAAVPTATDETNRVDGRLASRTSRKETSRFFIRAGLSKEAGGGLSSLHRSCFGRLRETKGGSCRNKEEVGTDAGDRATVAEGAMG
jgi:hypothetical protein